MSMRDPRHQPGIQGCHWIKSSWPGLLLEFPLLIPEKNPKAAVSSLISDINGFSDVIDGDHLSTFLTVYPTGENNLRLQLSITIFIHISNM
jgi:hypothetical protein